MLPNKLCFVDIETTGARWSDRVIEVGIIRVEDNKVVETYQSLINPNCYVPDEIIDLTGIPRAQLEYAPTFGQIKKEILNLLDDSIFVAHNVRFDYSFLRNEFKREEISFKTKHFCTVKLSRQLFPRYKHHNLDSIIERFGFSCESRHRALDDAKVLWQFYQKILKDFSEDLVKTTLDKILRRPTIPININQKILDDLPETPGVYIFYGKSGIPLYVGKSINIRDRVLSHFSNDHLSSTEMNIAQQVESIETVVTAGELGALFKEASLVKKMQPLYNRKLRHSRLITVLKFTQTDKNYSTVNLGTAENISSSDIEQILGVFKSKKSAKDYLIYLAKEFGLCEKLLGVDTTNQACFGYRLGKCKGACIGKEMPARYNLRFLEAFSKTKLKPWPFNGPIVISEKGKSKEAFLVNKWCYLGNVDIDSQQNENDDIKFDLDTYKILLRYILSSKNQKNIKPFIKHDLYPNPQVSAQSTPRVYIE